MKKNVMMRLASFLLVAVLISTSAISGTYAKYVTEKTGEDNARVAKFGVEISATVDGAFSEEYDATESVNDKNGTVIAKTVVAAATDYDNLVAPGTNGTLATFGITGTPEVAVNVKQIVDLELDGWTIGDADEYYCPLIITIDGVSYCGLDFASMDEYEAKIEEVLNNSTDGNGVNYPANSNLAAETAGNHTVSWSWPFDTTKGGHVFQDDVKDTALGDKAAAGTDITIAFDVAITVTQID